MPGRSNKRAREGEGLAYKGRRLHPNEVLRLSPIDAAEYAVAELLRAYDAASERDHATAATKFWSEYRQAQEKLDRLREEKHKHEQTELEGMTEDQLLELMRRCLHELPMSHVDVLAADIQEMRKPRLVVVDAKSEETTG